MGLKLKVNHLLWFVTPLVTSSVFAISPSLAATLASSETRLTINEFSHDPLLIVTLADTNTFAIESDGSVETQADADATATPSSFSSFSLSRTSGEGNSYFGMAESFAVVAYDFSVGKNETFSFDFNSFLSLQTSVDNPQFEFASAFGGLAFELYDTTNERLLDYFELFGNLTTPENSDSLEVEKSTNGTFRLGETSFNKSFGGTQEVANASVQGQFSRRFDSSTNLSLVKVSASEASVGVPEPPAVLEDLLIFGLIGVGYVGYLVRSKVLKAKSAKSR